MSVENVFNLDLDFRRHLCRSVDETAIESIKEDAKKLLAGVVMEDESADREW